MAQQQPTQEELRAMQNFQNQRFMALSYSQPIKANNENGDHYQQGRTIMYAAPTVVGAYAHEIEIRHKLKVNWDGQGTVETNAAYPYSLVNNITVNFGNKQISVHPYIPAKVDAYLEGYARVEADKAHNFVHDSISNLLHKFPTTLVAGDNDVVFSTVLPLNSLHPSSVNGLLPIWSPSTKLQVALTLPSAVVGKDPLDNVFNAQGGQITVEGTIEVVVHYRDYVSMADATQALEPNLNGLPTVQTIQIPSITNLGAGVFNYAAFKNPYKFAKIYHVIIDGKSSKEFADPANITGYSIDKAENSNSSFVRYADEVGMAAHYREVRGRFGTDLPGGVVVFDATTANIANVSSKMGSAYLNLDGSKGGYTAARFGFKIDEVGTGTGITPRILSWGIILNDEGIKAL